MRTVCLPWHVEEEGTRNVDRLISHSLQIVQTPVRHQTLDISTSPKLGFSVIVFIFQAKEVVVGWITIDPFVQQEGVTWQGLMESAQLFVPSAQTSAGFESELEK